MPKPKNNDPDHNLCRRGEVWWCRYVLARAERRVPRRTAAVKAARRGARDRLLREAAGQREGRGPEPVRKWEDAVEAYLAIQEALGRSRALGANTSARYETSIVQFSQALEGAPLDEITPATVLDFVMARRKDDLSSSAIRNDLTARSRVPGVAATQGWMAANPARAFNRKTYIGRDADLLDPPVDAEVARLVGEVAAWSADMADLIRRLRETGMRLGGALRIERSDIHPDDGRHATLRRGAKCDVAGLKTRTIDLGRAAAMLDRSPKTGRLFPGLSTDSAVVGTRHGQWCRQRRKREDREAAAAGRDAAAPARYRPHDQRRAFAIASLINDPTRICRLMDHLGHSSVKTTEVRTRFLRREGAQRRYTRDPTLFGSLPPAAGVPPRQMA